jgi:hypothetical protein
MPAQLDRSGELTALIEGGADRRCLGFGDDEHAGEHGGAHRDRQASADRLDASRRAGDSISAFYAQMMRNEFGLSVRGAETKSVANGRRGH